MKALSTALALISLFFLPLLSNGDPATIFAPKDFSGEYGDEPIDDPTTIYAPNDYSEEYGDKPSVLNLKQQFDSVSAQYCKIVQSYEKYCSYGSVSATQCLTDYQRECGVPLPSRKDLQEATDPYQQLCGDESSTACRQSLGIATAGCPLPLSWETAVPCPKVTWTVSNPPSRRLAPKVR